MSTEPALQPDRAVGEALLAIARNILVQARAAVSDPAKPDSAAVHDFRRQMKRWRALLRLLDPFLDEESRRLRLVARDLARGLSGARDAQSALDALADVSRHGVALSPASLEVVRKRIDGIREVAEQAILTAEMRIAMASALDEAEAAIETWPLQMLAFPQIAERLAAGYRSARRAQPHAWPLASAEELHELRKRVVNHRYQMEIVAPLWRRFGRMWIGEAQRLRERLGKHQDLLVLARLTTPHQPLAHWRSRILPAIEERKAAHVDASRRLAARLLMDKPRVFRRRLEVIWATED